MLCKNLAFLKHKHEYNLLDERSVIDRHRYHMAAKFGVFAVEDQCKLPSLYRLPRPYKSHFTENPSIRNQALYHYFAALLCAVETCALTRSNMGLVPRKPVFGVSDKARFKSVSSATETS